MTTTHTEPVMMEVSAEHSIPQDVAQVEEDCDYVLAWPPPYPVIVALTTIHPPRRVYVYSVQLSTIALYNAYVASMNWADIGDAPLPIYSVGSNQYLGPNGLARHRRPRIAWAVAPVGSVMV